MESKKVLITAAICFSLALIVQTLAIGSQPKAPAPECPSDNSCNLPDCYCATTDTPGSISNPNVPQIVFLSFDDAVTVSNYPFYEEALFDRKNPNGAPISVTFFVNHEYSNYSLIHSLWRKGHEIGLKSISHDTTTSYWANMNASIWRAEIIDQRTQVSRFANIPINDIKGMRAPFLQIGGNNMYSAVSQPGDLSWDCSRPTRTYRRPGLWPYTNDYRSFQECPIGSCPDESFPGFWTVPILDLIGDDQFPCSTVDECTPIPMTQASTYNLLLRNFNDIYNANRAPFGVFTRAQWIVGPIERPEFAQRMAGFIQFLDYLGTLNDVWIVSISKGLEWIKNPTSLGDLPNFDPWAPKPEEPNNCLFPRNCRYENGTWERFMSSCIPCPVNYPWVHNHMGA